MQQRQPRVGDIVDDYCPRERRLSDHAVVAMVGDAIRQTRCTACDTEHEYRQAKVPPARRKSHDLAPKPPAAMAAILAPKPADGALDADGPAGETAGAAARAAEPVVTSEPPSGPATDGPQVPASPGHEGPVHRRLIRAVLPRVEGEVPVRPAPEFTMHRPAVPPRPTGHNRAPRAGQTGFGRPGSKSGAGPARAGGQRGNVVHPGGRNAQHGGQPGHGARGGPRHSGPSGHGAHGGGRHGRPQHGGGQAPRKRH